MEPSVENPVPEERPLGRVLSEERERQGMSRAEAAQRLHMSAYQIEALEIGDYTRLPRGTFLRGFVRNYSKILGLDADAVLARLAEAAPRTPAPEIVVHSQNIRFDPLGGRLASPYFKAAMYALVAILFAFAAMYWWLFMRPSSPGQVSRKSPTAVSAQRSGPPQQIAAAPVAPPEPVAPRPAPTEPVKTEAPKVAAAKPPEPPKSEPPKAQPTKVAANDRIIKFRFRGEAWVEIKDAQGKVLFSRLNARGSEAEVSGKPPFQIVVGNAPDVDMFYNNEEFPLEPHTKVAVARFTVQ